MTFEPARVSDFLQLFEQYRNTISSVEGCRGVTLLRDLSNPNIFFTYSLWEGEEFLEKYRKSELFGIVWPATKRYFAAPAEAWTVTEVPAPISSNKPQEKV
jgi:quinol monooxygenase YgiN